MVWKIILPLFLGFFFFFLLSKIIPLADSGRVEKGREIPLLTTGRPELCLVCHKEKVPERAHGEEIVGCSGCHLGNPLTTTKTLAHRGMVKNPSDLRVVERTCGQSNCHPQDVNKVRKSLMATNHGIIRRLLVVFGEEKLLEKNAHLGVSDLIKKNFSLQESYALDYFRKLCGSCHLYLEKGRLKGFLGEKGGGCSACHLADFGKSQKSESFHPKLERLVPLERCLRCHNRSGRIGFTYQGLYETAQGGIYDVKWLDGRELLRIEADVHHKAGLHCIDCHTREEIMGDGNLYYSIEEALEVTCESCHKGIAKTRKGRRLTNLKILSDKLYLEGKFTGRLHQIKAPAKACEQPYHRRLSCSACHSQNVPQCMGCHVRFDPREKHLDKLKVIETRGLWEEYESYREIQRPALAIRENKVVPVTPG